MARGGWWGGGDTMTRRDELFSRMMQESPMMCQGCVGRGEHTWPCPSMGKPPRPYVAPNPLSEAEKAELAELWANRAGETP